MSVEKQAQNIRLNAPLFKLTATDALVPCSAEAITELVGSWPEAPVPVVGAAALERYKACGRLGAPLALDYPNKTESNPCPSTSGMP